MGSIQIQLEEFLETYRFRLENIIAEYNASVNTEHYEQIEQKLEQRLNELEGKIHTNQAGKINELEHKNQSSWKSLRQELINTNSQFNQANRNLSIQFNQQINNLKQDLDGKLSVALDDWSRQRAALQEWAVQRDEMHPSIEDYESKNRHELMTVVNPIRASFGGVDRQLKTMRNWLIASGLCSLLALAASGYILVSQVRSGNPLIVPKEDLVN